MRELNRIRRKLLNVTYPIWTRSRLPTADESQKVDSKASSFLVHAVDLFEATQIKSCKN